MILAVVVAAGCAAPGSLQIRDPQLPGEVAPLAAGESRYTLDNPMPADGRAYASYLKSNVALQRGDIASAIAFLEAAVRRDPEAQALKFRLASLLLAVDRKEEAAAALADVRIEPRDMPPELLSIYVDAVIDTGNGEIARKVVLEAFRQQVLSPVQLLRWVSLEEAQTGANDLLEFVRGLKQLRADEPMLHCVEGHLLMRASDYGAAAGALDSCLAEFPDWIPGLLERGLVAELSGDDETARALFEQVLQRQPGQALATWRLRSLAEPKSERREARRELSELLLEVRFETALQLASQAIGEQDPVRAEIILGDLPKALQDRPRVHILKGAIAEERGDLDAALDNYWRAMSGEDIRVRRVAALQWVRALRVRDVERWQQTATRRYRSQPDPSLALAIGLGIAERDLTAAVEYFHDRAIEYPADAELRYRLGVLYEQSGKRSDALEQMEQVIRIDSRHADALNFLGYSLAELGKDLARAEQLIRAALELKPRAGYIMDSLGWVLFQQGKGEEAVQWLERALEEEGPDPVILEHLGDAYAIVGRDEEARGAYREALRAVEDVDEAKRLRDKILNTRD